MTYLSPSQIRSLAETSTTAAAYLDACDNGARFVQLDPAYYQACARLLTTIFTVVDAAETFPDLLSRSPAARNAAESQEMEHHIRISRTGYYPQLAAILARASV
ncbi:MAG: hypothetical protein HGA71_20290 [Azonexaceae bacterium]|nr:hypothetical protein [Azonexaceae bacterium]